MCTTCTLYQDWTSAGKQSRRRRIFIETVDLSLSVKRGKMRTGPNIYSTPDNLPDLHVACLSVDTRQRTELLVLHTSHFSISRSYKQKQTHERQTSKQQFISASSQTHRRAHTHTHTCLRRLLFKQQTICLQPAQERVTYVQVSGDVNGYLALSNAAELVT